MKTTAPFTRALRLAALWVAIGATTSAGATARLHAQEVRVSPQPTIANLADQLGAKLGSPQSDELPVGGSFTGTLADPRKLATLGVTGVPAGARVTAMRIARDRVLVEIDVLDPAPLTRKVTLRLDDTGRLTPGTDR